MNDLLFAVISGQNVINAVIWLIIAGVIFFLLDWAIKSVGVPEPFNKVLHVVLILVAVIICINALLTLVGKPFISW
jgi:hypothetical protein